MELAAKSTSSVLKTMRSRLLNTVKICDHWDFVGHILKREMLDTNKVFFIMKKPEGYRARLRMARMIKRAPKKMVTQ